MVIEIYLRILKGERLVRRKSENVNYLLLGDRNVGDFYSSLKYFSNFKIINIFNF